MTGECNRFLERSGRKLPPADVHLVSLSDLVAHEYDDGDALGEFVADPSAVDPVDAASRRALPGVLHEAINALPDREAEVIRRRFLLGESLEKIAPPWAAPPAHLPDRTAGAAAPAPRPSARGLRHRDRPHLRGIRGGAKAKQRRPKTQNALGPARGRSRTESSVRRTVSP